MAFSTSTLNIKVNRRRSLSKGGSWLGLLVPVQLYTSSRNGALHIATSWKQTGVGARWGTVRENCPVGLRRSKMQVLPTVIHAEYRGEFRIRLVFNDGLEGTIDFSDWLNGPVFEPLKD